MVFYVGLTKQSLKVRLLGHISSCKTLKSEKDKIVFDIISLNKKPKIETIEAFKNNTDNSVCLLAEKYWIEQLRVWGFQLVNLSGTPENSLKRFGKKYKKKQMISKHTLHYKIMVGIRNGTPITY
jgi:hypothetical protein